MADILNGRKAAKQDQPDVLAVLRTLFGGDVLMNNTSGRYLSDHIEELIEERVQEAARQERERLSFDVDLGRVAIQFVDRAGDVADCDPAERICAEFHKAACEVCDRHRENLRSRPSATGEKG